MRTIYTTGGCVSVPFKISIDPVMEQNALKMRNFVIENNLRVAAFDLQPDQVGITHHGGFEISIRRVLKENQVNGGTIFIQQYTTEIGHQCYEEWMSASDSEDILQLPEVHFEEEFLTQFLVIQRRTREPWEILEVEHRQLLVPILNQTARDGIIRYSSETSDPYYARNLPYWEKVAEFCNAIIDGKREFTDLVDLCRQRSLEEGLRQINPEGVIGGNPERLASNPRG